MNPILFQTNTVLLDGNYLPGQYSWPLPVKLETAWLVCQVPPASGTLILALEVGGAPTPTLFQVPAGTGASSKLVMLEMGRLIVPPGQAVRWRASFEGPAQDAGGWATVTVNPARALGAITAPALRVVFQELGLRPGGVEILRYDPRSDQWSEPVWPGRFLARDGQNSITLNTWPYTSLVVLGGVVQAKDFIETGIASQDSPRLEFYVDATRVANLTREGVLRVASIAEGAPPALDSRYQDFYGRFKLFIGGQLTAVLYTRGFKAMSLASSLNHS
jgi:hypothetical protein